MASLGHIAIGMAAARVYPTQQRPRRWWIPGAVLWSILSLLPDADVIGLGFGVEYEDAWGHRGATHSFTFALILSTAIGAAAPLLRRPAVRTGVTAGLVLTSHPLLDTLTDGGLGCALLWPFDVTRYFASWRPIPVAPIGLDYLSPHGMMVAATELVLFSPLLWFALSPHGAVQQRGRRMMLLCTWLVSVWLIVSGDPIRERIVGAVLRDTTEFASGFSESALGSVEEGALQTEVRRRLGAPLREYQFYWPPPGNCSSITLEGEAVVSARDPDGCSTLGIKHATSRAEVARLIGAPEEACWDYSRSRGRGYYRARGVCFANERVIRIVRRWHRE